MIPSTDSAGRWLLKIELDGAWEECSFTTESEALATFSALVADYTARLERAILLSPAALAPRTASAGVREYLN